MHQAVELVVVVARQARGQRRQRVLQVAVVVERFDEEGQRGTVVLAQAQAQGLPVQEGRQRLLAARELGGVGALAVVVGSGVARRRGRLHAQRRAP